MHPKKVPLKTPTKSQTWVRCTLYCYPKVSLYKIPDFRVMPIYPRKALLQNPLVQPSPVGIVEAWGCIPTIWFMSMIVYCINSLDGPVICGNFHGTMATSLTNQGLQMTVCAWFANSWDSCWIANYDNLPRMEWHIRYSYGHLLVITGYKWDYTIYKWGYKYL